ncbi:MAG: hypothetical protein A3F31_03665 [Candidatus Levybacteria bacterium RIFCSPHIGHO2_12_FULL_38_12]|nr:MAG: hypothetical protein A3F31_03665 [Candidatus Levybacteria bacterium RIFCSPHIGHO2_12_FULL_38_12]OGH34433.1 MAG: hypothetical protein A3A47_02900 [Candidatus Levybacteria bacterium RIFCSPLOWO2_01_FULL_37_20]
MGDITHAEIQIAKEEDLETAQGKSIIGNAVHEAVVYLYQKKLNLALAGGLTAATILGVKAVPIAWELTKAKENEVVVACDNMLTAQIPLMKDQPSQSEIDDAKKACRQLAWRALDIAEDNNPFSNPRKLLGIGYILGLAGAGLGALASWASLFDYKRRKPEA